MNENHQPDQLAPDALPIAPDPPLLDPERAALHCLSEIELCRSLVLLLEQLEVSTWGKSPSVLVRPASMMVPPREGYSPTAVLLLPIGEYLVSQLTSGPMDGAWFVAPESMAPEECAAFPDLGQALAYLIEHAGAQYALAEIEAAAEELQAATSELERAIHQERQTRSQKQARAHRKKQKARR